jgi:hypothetical protein
LKFGPLPVAPQCVKFQLHTTMAGGATALTTFHMKITGTISASDSLTVLTTLATSWNTRLAPLTNSQWTLTQTSLVDIGSRNGVSSALPITHPGTSAGAANGAAVSFVMSAHVSLRYRGGHSRVYIPGINQGESSDLNSWSPAGQGQVSAAWQGILTDLAASPPAGLGAMSQVVVRYISSDKRDFSPPPEPFTPPYLLATPMILPINSWSANPQFASQRRRNQQ